MILYSITVVLYMIRPYEYSPDRQCLLAPDISTKSAPSFNLTIETASCYMENGYG
jgi:hypothetical protein